MRSNIHTKFIVTPIFDILKDTVAACRGLKIGIETQPLGEYLFQNTFLKMSGASEQKLKCICWEIATYDYDYRYHKLTKPLGECSCYDEKKNIFQEILKAIAVIDPYYDFKNLFPDVLKTKIIEDARKRIISLLESSMLTRWECRTYIYFKTQPTNITATSFAKYNNQPTAKSPYSFLESELKNYYENVVYRHRNRLAHNLLSYQSNLPTLRTLATKDYEDENYFSMFLTLIVIDELFIKTYQEYLRVLNSAMYFK